MANVINNYIKVQRLDVFKRTHKARFEYLKNTKKTNISS